MDLKVKNHDNDSDKIGKWTFEEIVKRGLWGCLIIAILYICIINALPSDVRSTLMSSNQTSNSITIGNEITLKNDCNGAISESHYKKYSEYRNAEDSVGIVLMIASGEIKSLKAGDTVKVITTTTSYVRGRVLTGDASNSELYIGRYNFE